MQRKKSYFTICFILLIWSISIFSSYGQANDKFNEFIEEVVRNKPKDHTTLESVFRQFKNDTTKMKVLAFESFSVNYIEGQCYALNALGCTYRNLSKYEKAIESHKKAEELAIKVNNIELRIISLNMLGVVYRRMDLVRSALDYHSQALVLANSVEVPSESIWLSTAVSLNSMGNIYLALEQYDMALEKFEQSLDIEVQAKNKLGLAINHHNIGYAKEGKGLLDEALKNYAKSLSYNNEINSDVGRAICYNSIGCVYIKQKKYDEAHDLISQALEKANSAGDQYYVSTVLVSMGWVETELGNIQKAEQHLKKAILIATDYKLKSVEVNAHERLHQLYRKKGDPASALTHFEAADSIHNTITSQRNINYINDLVIKYESDTKTEQINALALENEQVKLHLERIQLMVLFGVLGLILTFILFTTYNRNKKLKVEKKILTLEQDMLRSQMNPHFIFNSLNSIKLYIINNEKENAVYYLNKFAKLIRKILVSSTEKLISLSDELETMELYMNIENIRFNDEIDFKITIDKSVNPENIKVPSLILQPFLENALWHGLSSKKEDKQIRLEVKQQDEQHVMISITDNGVGRKASASIKNQKTLKRKSLGLKLTRERLDNFSKGFRNDYAIKIVDLYNDQNQPIGTKVIIEIPLIQSIRESA